MAPEAEPTAIDRLPDGNWLCRGYGILVEAAAGAVRAWDISPAGRIERPDAGRLFQNLTRIALSDDGRQLLVRRADSITAYAYERLGGAPNYPLIAAGTHDPVVNFEVLWHAFNQDYGFFAERGVDWRRQYEIFRPQVTAQTTPAALFDLLSQMLDPLDDRHVRLVGDGRFANSGWGPVLQPIVDDFHAQSEVKDFTAFWRGRLWPFHEATVARHLGGSARAFGPNIVAGRIGPDVGYLFVARMYGYVDPEDDVLANRSAAVAALDEAFQHLRGVKRMVLDLRLNGGGDDGIVLELAGRFTSATRPGFRKWPGPLRRGEAQDFAVHPTGDAPFEGPLAVLISNVTVSAGENLAMILKTFPNTILIGERTASVHSDILPKTLPNGWTVTISNEIFENSDGVVYEAKGVPPALEAPYFRPALLAGGPDPGIEAALRLLDRQA